MNIALIANNSKKELMVQFCIAYSGILSQSTAFCATGIDGQAGCRSDGSCTIFRFLSGEQGGEQQIAARIACNESIC
jgi:methylglyoxal synthase